LTIKLPAGLGRAPLPNAPFAPPYGPRAWPLPCSRS
jgi:hypothetical protein